MASPQSRYSATVTWNPPPKSSWNGFITKYQVKVDAEDKIYHAEYDVKVDDISHDKMEYPISKLSPGTKYSVTVTAFTSVGHGNLSDPPSIFTTHGLGMCLTQFVLCIVLNMCTWCSLS